MSDKDRSRIAELEAIIQCATDQLEFEGNDNAETIRLALDVLRIANDVTVDNHQAKFGTTRSLFAYLKVLETANENGMFVETKVSG